jgi:hypothetical protein
MVFCTVSYWYNRIISQLKTDFFLLSFLSCDMTIVPLALFFFWNASNPIETEQPIPLFSRELRHEQPTAPETPTTLPLSWPSPPGRCCRGLPHRIAVVPNLPTVSPLSQAFPPRGRRPGLPHRAVVAVLDFATTVSGSFHASSMCSSHAVCNPIVVLCIMFQQPFLATYSL